MNEKLAKYTIFLNSVENILQKYFEEQKEYIKCSAGCSYCCESGSFPASEIEYSFVKEGFNKLDKDTKKKIRIKSLNLYEKRYIHLQKGRDIFDFTYQCPFLENKNCLVYEYRPVICRIHGLITCEYSKESAELQKANMPCCTPIGLNYAEVWDDNLKIISTEKAKLLGKKIMPKIYPVSYSKLLDELQEIGYGDIRMLFEWVLLDIPNYQEIIDKIKNKITNKE